MHSLHKKRFKQKQWHDTESSFVCLLSMPALLFFPSIKFPSCSQKIKKSGNSLIKINGLILHSLHRLELSLTTIAQARKLLIEKFWCDASHDRWMYMFWHENWHAPNTAMTVNEWKLKQGSNIFVFIAQRKCLPINIVKLPLRISRLLALFSLFC